MKAAGLLFMSHTKPLATVAKDGTYQLTLLAFDRMGPHRVEPWRITYSGPAAQAWYDTNGAHLVAGTPLQVKLAKLRNFTNGSRSGGPEFVCDVISIQRLASHAKTPSTPYQSSVTSY